MRTILNDLSAALDELLPEVFNEFHTQRKIPEPAPIHLEICLAGVKKEEIKITTNSTLLKISVNGKKKVGVYDRVISLSDRHDSDGIKVSYEDGLLEIDVPLKEGVKSKEREVIIK